MWLLFVTLAIAMVSESKVHLHVLRGIATRARRSYCLAYGDGLS